MKKIIKVTYVLFVIMLIFTSCSNQEENIFEESSISVSKASIEVSSAFADWNKSTNNFLQKNNYSTDIIMFEENNSEKIIYSANW